VLFLLRCVVQARAELLAAKAATSNAEKAARAAREEERQRAWQQQQAANAQRAAEVAADRVKAKQAQVRATLCSVCKAEGRQRAARTESLQSSHSVGKASVVAEPMPMPPAWQLYQGSSISTVLHIAHQAVFV
jgi:hypothetical protein